MRNFVYIAGDAASHKELGKKLSELKPGSYVIQVKKNRAIRSLSANRYYHLILNVIGIETGHTHDELHEALKLKFNSKIVYFPKGGSQLIGNSTSNLDSAEFFGYVNRVKQWAIDEFGIVIPDQKDVTYEQWLAIEDTYELNQNG
jgi:hypothetical protein